METFRNALYDIVETNQPCSVRQVYYLGIGRFWDKDVGQKSPAYDRVCSNLGKMREGGDLPFEWIADSTRYRRIRPQHNSVEEALEETARFYRRDLWRQQPRHIEVWTESDSITGVIDDVVMGMGAGLFSCRGQSSKSFAHGAAVEYERIGKPVTVLYVGDWDPTGLGIQRSLLERLRRYSNGSVDIDLDRVAVTSSDVRWGRLVSHSVNKNDNNHKRFKAHCERMRLDPNVAIEAEAIPPTELRERVHEALLELVEDIETWNGTLAAEESEREIMMRIARRAS
jgi:hypothetical protein